MTFLEQATANYVCDTCGQVRFKRQCEGHAFKDRSLTAKDTPAPRGDAMTIAELDAIRERLAAAKAWKPFIGSVDDMIFGQRAMRDVEALLAEVDRLQAEVNLYLPVVAAAEILKANYQRETDRIRKLLSDAGDAARKARVENKFLRERNRRDEAVSLLAEQEWVTDGRECLVYCIHCRQPESKGHDDYCRAFGRHGVVTSCREESTAQAERFEALMREIDEAVTP